MLWIATQVWTRKARQSEAFIDLQNKASMLTAQRISLVLLLAISSVFELHYQSDVCEAFFFRLLQMPISTRFRSDAVSNRTLSKCALQFAQRCEGEDYLWSCLVR